MIIMREYENDFNTETFEKFYNDDNYAAIQENGAKARKQYVITKKGVALLTALCVVISAVFGVGGALVASKAQSHHAPYLLQSSRSHEVNLDLTAAPGGKLSVQQVIALTADSVVEINTEVVRSDIWMRQYTMPGAGSGVIISSDGYIMTNNHVIESTGKISVTLRNGSTYDARLIGTDDRTDVAVIKIDATDLSPVVFGDSDGIVMGDLVVAIGNPLGQLGGTATSGIISSLDRQLTIEGNKTMSLLQTDAAINRGNSGGGLFNEYGEIIGLVVAKSSGLGIEGLGFAIPINTAKHVAMQLLENGYVKGRPQIGIEMVDLTSAQDAVFYGVRNLGVYVKTVFSDNAKAAGIKEGDMLYYIEDVRIEKPTDLTDELMKHSVGDKVKLTVVRDDDIIDLVVELSEQKQN